VNRPLADKRPFGPFVDLNLRDSVSYFNKIEVQTNPAEDDTIYTVIGILSDGSIGLTVETNAFIINGDSTFALFERESGGSGLDIDDYTGDAGVEFIATGDGRVGIGQASRDLTEIIVEDN